MQYSDQKPIQFGHKESHVQKELIFKWREFATFVLLSGLSSLAIINFSRQWFSYNDWQVSPFIFSVLTVIVFFRIANSLARWLTLPMMSRPRYLAPAPGLKVGVVTTIVPEAESLMMLERSVSAMISMDYPHDTWVLDEGDDERVKEICRQLGAFHFSRKHLTQYQTDSGSFQSRSKHGNYNAWLQEIGFDRYQIIVAFDPDHVPVPSFLNRVIGYFSDPAVGYVQSAQVYYNQNASFIARGAAEETYEYYSCAQMAAFTFDQPAIVGCHNAHRVSALKELGGFAAHDADDLLTGLLYNSLGWKGVYVPEILAKGLTPVDWTGYLTQQLRWARSVIDIKYRLRQLSGRKLQWSGKIISAIHGLFYLQNGITTFLANLALIYILITGDIPDVIKLEILPHLSALLTTLQICAFYRQRFYLAPGTEWGLHLKAHLLRYAKWPVFIRAIWEVLAGRRVPYALTRKVKVESKNGMLIVPHTLLIIAISLSAVIGKMLGSDVSLPVYLLAALAIMVSMALIMTTRLPFPKPYE